jgi:hypothetical protein
MTAIVGTLIAREYDRDWAPIQDLAMHARFAHTIGSLVRGCLDDARLGFLRFQLQTWLMSLRPDHRDRALHKHTFAANAHTCLHVCTLSNFVCANSWLNCVRGRALDDGMAVPRNARV